MKKIISLMLCVVLVCSMLAACSKETKNNNVNNQNVSKDNSQSHEYYGTEGAKILLARQRLDGNNLSGFKSASLSSEPIVLGKVYASLTEGIGGIKGSVVNVSKALTCTEFPDYCNYADYYSAYMNNIDNMIERNVDLIDYIKNYVSITDRWIDAGGEAYLLQVNDHSEVVYVKGEYGYTVFKRYTNEYAQNVYEMYIDESADYGTTKVKFLCIPGARYEYTELLNHGEQSDLTLVADKSNGYWSFFLISGSDVHANVNNLIMLDDIYYEASHYVNVNGDNTNNPLRVMTSDFKYDIFWISDYEVELCLTGFTGVASVTGVDENGNGSLTLANGTTILPETELCEGKARMSYATVGEIANIGLYGTVAFSVEGETIAERLANTKTLLAELGIQCKVDYDTMAKKTVSASVVAANFKDTYVWNGTYLRTYDEVAAGFAVEKTKMDEYAALYAVVKDAEVVSQEEMDAIPREAFFTKINDPQFGTVAYENEVISVSGMSFTLNDSVFVEEGIEYTIGMDLIRIDDNGDMSYGESVALAASNMQKTVCADKSTKLTVNQTATYQMTSELYDGNYMLVAYVCTVDGIRISQMVPVVFGETESQEKLSDTFKMTISLNDSNNMIVSYVSIVDIEMEFPMEKDSYTYEEMYNKLMEVSLNYGYPSDKALEIMDEETRQWSELAADSQLTGGTIRFTYIVNQETGQEGSIVCSLIKQ